MHGSLTALTPEFIATVKRRIETAIVPALKLIYGHGGTTFAPDFRPGLKELEKIVSFYDYAACGISVLAPLAARGDAEALRRDLHAGHLLLRSSL